MQHKIAATKPGQKTKTQIPGLASDQLQQFRQAFNLFDTQAKGKIDPIQLKSAMLSMGFQTKNPSIYNMIADLQAEGRQIDFDEFLENMGSRMGDRESRGGINKMFDLFNDQKSQFMSLKNMKRIAKELGQTMSEGELEQMLQRVAGNGKELSRQDFYNIMTKKTF